jgi:cyclopropane fatty-acyl-phospholipid synthase-like methyltransferase
MKQLLNKLIRPIIPLTYSKKERRHALVGHAKLWKMKRDFQIKFLGNMGLKPEDYLLEIGCGTLRGGLPLIQYLNKGHYFGIEVREQALKEGRKELKEAGLEEKNPTLLLSPAIAQLTINRTFDYLWAFSVLIHMNDEILNDTLEFASKHLSEKGIFYANVNIGESKEGNWQGFPVVWRTFDFYSRACAMNGLAVADLGPLKALGHRANIESQDTQRMLKIYGKD